MQSSIKGRHDIVMGRQSHISHRGARWLHGIQNGQCIDTYKHRNTTAAAEKALRQARYEGASPIPGCFLHMMRSG